MTDYLSNCKDVNLLTSNRLMNKLRDFLDAKRKIGGCDIANIAIANTANKQSTTLLENASFKLP